jgi:hypothetical protein
MFGALHISRMAHAWFIVCVLNRPSRVWYRMYDVNMDMARRYQRICVLASLSLRSDLEDLRQKKKTTDKGPQMRDEGAAMCDVVRSMVHASAFSSHHRVSTVVRRAYSRAYI